MKKLIFLSAFIVALAMTSCGKSPQDYMKEMNKLQSEYAECIANGDTDKASKIEKEYIDLVKEMYKRSLEDPEFAQECQEMVFETFSAD